MESVITFSAVNEEAVRIKVLKLHVEARVPKYAHVGAFGDLAADLYAVADVRLEAGATVAVAASATMPSPW